MTPEERFRNMENLLSTLLDGHVRFHEDMEEMKEVQRKLIEAQSRNEAEIEKNTVAIRDLILVSRSVVDSQRVTEEKLNALIETVDRIIRYRNA